MTSDHFGDVSDMEPLLPRDSMLDAVLEKAHNLRTEALQLAGARPAGGGREMARLLRSMNAHGSNKLDGEPAGPLDIERALAQVFSDDEAQARLQRLAVAHIHTEQWLSEQVMTPAQATSIATVQAIHAHLFGQMEAHDRLAHRHGNGAGITEEVVMAPGAIRAHDLIVGSRTAPGGQALAAMLERWAGVYGHVRRGEMQIVAAAAAHHRLVWLHPFGNGNGRVARLHTLAVLRSLGLTHGLWSPLRGLAHGAEAYRDALANADMPRLDDQDGRGQRSERMLLAWIDLFIGVCLDQVRFMRRMLHVQDMQNRLGALLAHEEKVVQRGIRMESLRPLHYLFATEGELPRRDFSSMTGLGERTATTQIGKLLEAGLLVSDTPRGAVRMGIPLHALRFLFPGLWPEAEAHVASAA